MRALRDIPLLGVSVPSYESIGTGSDAHIAYNVHVSVPRDTYREAHHEVSHRFSEFAALYEAVSRRWSKQVELPKLPSKRPSMIPGALSSRQLNRRREELETFVQQLVQTLNWTADESLREFLEVEVWLRERKSRPRG